MKNIEKYKDEILNEHQEWLDATTRLDWDVRGREPMQWGDEPIQKIERAK